MASQLKLVTADKKDSQGLCFIGKVRLPDFLQQKLKPKKGRIIKISSSNKLFQQKKISSDELQDNSKPFDYNIKDGQEIGFHNGAHFYTIGQRKGLAVGGTKDPLYAVSYTHLTLPTTPYV